MSLLAICIPVWNRQHTIIDAISSVVSQGRDVDIHIFDNASSDVTVEVVKERFGSLVTIHYSKENMGYVWNINRCLRLAEHYEWIGILHSDDVHLSKSISTFERYSDSFPNTGIIFSSTSIIGSSGECIQKGYSEEHVWQAGKEAVQRCQHQIPCSATFYNAQAVREHGLFSPEYPYSADEEYNSRLASTFDVIQMDTVVAGYRHHEGHLMYATWAKDDFISNFETMRIKMDSYLKEYARGEKEVKKDVAEMLALQTISLVAYDNYNRVIANRFFKNLWLKSPVKMLHPSMLVRLFICNVPYFASSLCRKLSRSVKS